MLNCFHIWLLFLPFLIRDLEEGDWSISTKKILLIQQFFDFSLSICHITLKFQMLQNLL